MTSIRVGVVALAVLLATAAPASADTTETHNIGGQPHTFVVPDGWSTFEKGGAVGFTPPLDKVHAPFECRIWATKGSISGSPIDYVKKLAEDEKTKNKTWATLTEPKDFTFVGVTGALVFLSGTSPAGTYDLMAFVTSSANGLIYYFTVSATYDDLNALGTPIDLIVNGVAGKGGTARKSAKLNLDDANFGVAVEGLDSAWQVAIEKGAWVISSSAEPATTFRIARVWADKKYKAKFGKKTPTVSVHDTTVYVGKDTVVDKKSKTKQRTWTLVREDHALEISMTSAAFDDAVAKVLPVFLEALSFRVPPTFDRKAKGIDMTLPNDVIIKTDPKDPWKLDAVTASGATFVYASKESGEIIVFTRARRAAGDLVDPFVTESKGFAKTCADLKGEFEELDITFKGADEAKRYRCRNAKGSAAVMILARGKGATPVHFMLMARYKKARSDTPDGIAAEFTYFVTLPR